MHVLVTSSEVRVRVLVLSSATVAAGLLEVIIAVGGEDDKVVLRSVESYDVTTRQWRTLACLPYAVSKHGLVVSGESASMVSSSVVSQQAWPRRQW